MSSSYKAFSEAPAVQKSDWLKMKRNFLKATLIVAGDFNQGLVDYHYYGSKKKPRPLESTLKECHLWPIVAGDNDPIARDSLPRANFDHICIASPQAWGVGETKRWPDAPVLDKSLSEHFAVEVKILWNP